MRVTVDTADDNQLGDLTRALVAELDDHPGVPAEHELAGMLGTALRAVAQ